MTWLRDTIAGRTIVVLVLGLGSILALAQYLYQSHIEREVTAQSADSVVERLLIMANTILSIEPDKRDAAAHRMSGGPLELHWGREPLATAGGNLDDVAIRLRDRLIERSPTLAALGLVIGTSRSVDPAHQTMKGLDDQHTTLVSVPLTDGSWLNVTLARVQTTRAASPSVLLSAVLGGLGVVLVSVLMGRWLTRPLENLATGARRLFPTLDNPPLPEAGTREVRTLASAINDLQRRIRRLVDDRTQMLAAVSHDLRSPLTRLRLRIENVSDHAMKRSIIADLDEMEAMIDATLSFLRDDMASEKVQQVDVAAILETIADDAADTGQTVVIDAPRSLVIAGRHLALKRALTNLVQNAVKYGGSAHITAKPEGAQIRIAIADEGAGIPDDKLEAVFDPFYRIESSRARGTGGHGLGLTIARSIMRAHGGDVRLQNIKPRGLLALIDLPIGTPTGESQADASRA